jgi:hypothetical protein
MTPENFGWMIIGTVAFTLLVLTIREDLLRRAGK